MDLTIYRIHHAEGATAEIIATDIVGAINGLNWKAQDCVLLSERVVSSFLLSLVDDRVQVNSLNDRPYTQVAL